MCYDLIRELNAKMYVIELSQLHYTHVLYNVYITALLLLMYIKAHIQSWPKVYTSAFYTNN